MKQAELKSLSEFYTICKKIVKGYPAQYGDDESPEMVALRLNTFAVVRSLKDFDADNVNKRPQFADSPYFYSREWANSGYVSGSFKTEYPILGVAEDKSTLKLAKTDKHKLNLFIIDQIPQFGKFYSDVYSKNREQEDVANDIRNHFKKFIELLNNWVYVTGGVTGWHDKQWLIDENIVHFVEAELRDYVSLDVIEIEVFPGIVDGCMIGVANIEVSTNGCVIGLPKINYDVDDVHIVREEAN